MRAKSNITPNNNNSCPRKVRENVENVDKQFYIKFAKCNAKYIYLNK